MEDTILKALDQAKKINPTAYEMAQHLAENFPGTFRQLAWSGKLMPYLKRKSESYLEMLVVTLDRVNQANPIPEKADLLEAYQHSLTNKEIAEELLSEMKYPTSLGPE